MKLYIEFVNKNNCNFYRRKSNRATARYPERERDNKKSLKTLKHGNQLRNLFSQVKNEPEAFPFPCKICVRSYATKKSCNLHLKLHRIYKYPCSKCKYPYSTASKMESHQKHCEYSGKNFRASSQDNEIKTGSPSPEDPLKENSSSSNNDNEEDDDDEDWPIINEDEDDEKNEAKIIPVIATTEIKPVSGLKNSRREEFQCKLCLTKRIFLNARSYERHKRRHRLCKHPCPKCRYPCQSESAVQRHLKHEMCSNETVMYKCDFCDFETVSGSSEYLEHRNMHRQEKKNKKLEDDDLGVILTSSSGGNDKKGGKFCCKICVGKRHFKSSEYYLRHLSHHKYRKYPCPKCKYPCKSEKSLEGHMSPGGRCSFAEERKQWRRQFRCDICDFGPATKTGLAEHRTKAHKRVKQTKEEFKLKCTKWRKKREQLAPFISCHLCPFKTKYQKILDPHIKRVRNFNHSYFNCSLNLFCILNFCVLYLFCSMSSTIAKKLMES